MLHPIVRGKRFKKYYIHYFCLSPSEYICHQSQSQTVTGVTFVTGPGRSVGACGGPGRVPKGPKAPQEGSRKGSDQGLGCKSKGRCGLCLRKRKKRTKKKGCKGVLEALGGPEGSKKGPYSVPGRPGGHNFFVFILIGVLKKGKKKEKRGTLGWLGRGPSSTPRGSAKRPQWALFTACRGPHWVP
jgi:hypothetical protein